MTDRRLPLAVAVSAVLVLAASGAALLHARTGQPAPAPPVAQAPALAPSPPALPAPLSFIDGKNALGVGLPRGCSLRGPVRRASAHGSGTMFFAADGQLGELVLVESAGRAAARPADAGDMALKAGALSLQEGAAPRHLAHFDPLAPPSLAFASGAWMALYPRPGLGTMSRAVLWREGGSPEVLAEGDALSTAELRCHDQTCAALLSRELRAAAPGATLVVGDAGRPGSTWARADFVPDGTSADRPFVVARVGRRDGAAPAEVTATTTDRESVQFFTMNGGTIDALARLPTPFGPLDALLLARPVAFAHGAQLQGQCAVPRPALSVVRQGLPTAEIGLDAPVMSLFARPLASGAVVAWLTPASCGDERRKVVYAMLTDDDGTPRSSPMAVSDAQGFALTTRGAEADLWLLRGPDILWIRARCAPEG
jgi:hypothetical protein